MMFSMTFTCLLLVVNVDTLAQGRGRKGGGGGAPSRPSASPAAAPSRGSSKSINGGSVKKAERPSVKSTPQTGNSAKGNGQGNAISSKRPSDGKGSGNTVGSGNKVNINSGNTTNNVNINVKKNTTVRHNSYRPYSRPPYHYGGYRYHCHYHYHYHPYRPYYWGPMWHPWGFFITTLAVTAIIVSVDNQQYHYDNGVFYMPATGGYTVVSAPVGATVTTIPSGSQTVVINETTNNYYYGGTYYEKGSSGYTVVPPTAGSVVESLPEGGEEVKIGDVTYVKIGETYYQPIDQDGKSMYEVVMVEEDK
jgi:hypothetical protein